MHPADQQTSVSFSHQCCSSCWRLIVFCVHCVSWYVGCSFWPPAFRSCEKWFSTMSWLTIAGFITNPGNLESFSFTTVVKPRIIDCKSNHHFDETNSLPFVDCCCHCKKLQRVIQITERLSLTWNIPCLSENSFTILLVWQSKFIVESSLVGSSSFTVHKCSLYAFKNRNSSSNVSHIGTE